MSREPSQPRGDNRRMTGNVNIYICLEGVKQKQIAGTSRSESSMSEATVGKSRQQPTRRSDEKNAPSSFHNAHRQPERLISARQFDDSRQELKPAERRDVVSCHCPRFDESDQWLRRFAKRKEAERGGVDEAREVMEDDKRRKSEVVQEIKRQAETRSKQKVVDEKRCTCDGSGDSPGKTCDPRCTCCCVGTSPEAAKQSTSQSSSAKRVNKVEIDDKRKEESGKAEVNAKSKRKEKSVKVEVEEKSKGKEDNGKIEAKEEKKKKGKEKSGKPEEQEKSKEKSVKVETEEKNKEEKMGKSDGAEAEAKSKKKEKSSAKKEEQLAKKKERKEEKWAKREKKKKTSDESDEVKPSFFARLFGVSKSKKSTPKLEQKNDRRGGRCSPDCAGLKSEGKKPRARLTGGGEKLGERRSRRGGEPVDDGEAAREKKRKSEDHRGKSNPSRLCLKCLYPTRSCVCVEPRAGDKRAKRHRDVDQLPYQSSREFPRVVREFERRIERRCREA